ncbi:MAG TPA: aminoacyl-histidine dipeptidase [Thermoanaerobaculia bacterium]|jgi:dipeptidase D|nr:aminoacyl-histidine dipeptidase [Thermoanaerobaculia bacterium]
MSTFVSELEPTALWQRFDEILAIPRPSTREEAARQYVLDLAGRKGLRHREDATGNLVIEKPASPGLEGAPTVVLQGHLDMVTEKNAGVEHDFERDPIVPRRDDGWVKATGTTLGSDNGIGVAAILAVMMADDLQHGPLELLFTVDEETGLTGAVALDPEAIALRGRLLLNLDSEEVGTVTIGCAGGAVTRLLLPLETAPAPAGEALDLRLSGLRGGHSGLDIKLQRGNAVQLLARAVYSAAQGRPVHLASFRGGNKQNALAREAVARVIVQDRAAFVEAVEKEIEGIKAEYKHTEPDLQFEVSGGGVSGSVWSQALGERLLLLLNGLPHGVLAMSHDLEGLVETSVNLAAVSEEKSSVVVLLSVRSSVGSALRAQRHRLRAFADLVGAQVEENEGYPAWRPNPDSALLARFQKVHERVAGEEAELVAVHAGLECGVIGEKFPGMDMISFGPQIEGAHSPDERVKVDTVGPFYRLLTETLAELARG